MKVTHISGLRIISIAALFELLIACHKSPTDSELFIEHVISPIPASVTEIAVYQTKTPKLIFVCAFKVNSVDFDLIFGTHKFSEILDPTGSMDNIVNDAIRKFGEVHTGYWTPVKPLYYIYWNRSEYYAYYIVADQYKNHMYFLKIGW